MTPTPRRRRKSVAPAHFTYVQSLLGDPEGYMEVWARFTSFSEWYSQHKVEVCLPGLPSFVSSLGHLEALALIIGRMIEKTSPLKHFKKLTKRRRGVK